MLSIIITFDLRIELLEFISFSGSEHLCNMMIRLSSKLLSGVSPRDWILSETFPRVCMQHENSSWLLIPFLILHSVSCVINAHMPLGNPWLSANHCRLRLERRWQNLTLPLPTCHLWEWVHFSTLPGGWMDKRVSSAWRLLPGRLSSHTDPGWWWFHVSGPFPSNAQSPLSPLDAHINGVWYRPILQNTLLPFARRPF